MKISMIGCGKLGLPCAEVMADLYSVIGYDIQPFHSTTVPSCDSIKDAVEGRDIIFVAVPTPHDPQYGGSTPITGLQPRDFDYTIAREVLKEINQWINRDQLVVLISTVLPGTVRRHLAPLITRGRFIYNPYLIAMGSVKWDMVNPECVIIGTENGDTTGDAKILTDFYRPLMANDPPHNIGTWEEAESIKIFYNCYSDDTEVLTSSGWKLFKDATSNDSVLSLNPATMIPEWVTPTKFVESEYVGDMIHFTSTKDDILVTPTHNMLYGTQVSTKDPGYSCSYKWSIAPAEEIVKKNSFVFQRSTKWHNYSPATVEINGLVLDSFYYVQFMAWYLSEGCLSGNRVIISQSKDVNPEKYEMIREVMTNIYQSHSNKKSRRLLESQSGFSVLWDELADYLRQFGKSFEKFIPAQIKTMGVDMIRLFLDTYNLADGSAMPEVNFKGEITYNKKYKYYATSSDQMAADLGELIIKVGRFPSYRTTQTDLSNKPCHLIYELVGRTSSFQKSSSNGLKFNIVEYDGKIYCAMLPKNHVFLTRRNGKCTWQGNTFISVKIGLVNMIQDVAERVGNMNVDVVTDALKGATQRITGPSYLTAGMGDGGACHPRDNIALRWMAQELDLGYDLFDAIMTSRERQAANMADRLIELSQQYDLPIAIHGIAYKPCVEYTIGSYSLLVSHYITERGHSVVHIDPLTGDGVNLDRPHIILAAHNPRVTYGRTGVDVGDAKFYCHIPDGSVILDPWRTLTSTENYLVIPYGNTRASAK